VAYRCTIINAHYEKKITDATPKTTEKELLGFF
jgi:hypothetical protein